MNNAGDNLCQLCLERLRLLNFRRIYRGHLVDGELGGIWWYLVALDDIWWYFVILSRPEYNLIFLLVCSKQEWLQFSGHEPEDFSELTSSMHACGFIHIHDICISCFTHNKLDLYICIFFSLAEIQVFSQKSQDGSALITILVNTSVSASNNGLSSITFVSKIFLLNGHILGLYGWFIRSDIF